MRQLTFLGPRQLEWREVPEPRPEAGSAVVRPVVVATCDIDPAILRGMPAFPGPFAFGHECIADVVETGADVTAVRPGQRVVVPFQIACGACDRCRRGLTANCRTVPSSSMYGMGGRRDWGGALADLMYVPFADAMLVPAPDGVAPQRVASASDQLPDAWRTVGPALRSRPGADVLVVAGDGNALSLYAAGMARALGAGSVTYLSSNRDCLGVAEALQVSPVELPLDGYPRRAGRFPVVVDASSSVDGLACALRSTEPGGICTSPSIYWNGDVPVPMFDMYNTGLTLMTGKVHARTVIPDVLDLVVSEGFDPSPVTTTVAAWEDAPEALLGSYTKLLITRE